MDHKPVEILMIRNDNPIRYYLNIQSLQRILEPIKDKEVAVFSIVSSSRNGKSFMLNFMCQYMKDPKNIDRIGEGHEPHTGFHWKSNIEPQTTGIWLSKPFLLRKSNGKEIAVLFMDTEGIFDPFPPDRDWSTIVGLSLLMSSCLILNVFDGLDDDILNRFDQFIQYGLKAGENKECPEPTCAFQSLLILIGDWNYVSPYNYGLTGGKRLLDKILTVTDEQTATAQRVRQYIRKCFKDISCFLMPRMGDDIEKIDFNGRADLLNPRFKGKMKEFISKILNPEEIIPKRIGNAYINGEELGQYFRSYVEVFNRKKEPTPEDIIEATAKIKNQIRIRKLKVQF